MRALADAIAVHELAEAARRGDALPDLERAFARRPACGPGRREQHRGIGGGPVEIPFPTLTNLRGRYRADLGITLVGPDVDAWADQSGIGNDLSAPAAGARPLYVASGFNGSPYPYLELDGTAERLTRTVMSWGGVTTSYSLAFIMQVVTASATDILFQYAGSYPYGPGAAGGQLSMNDNGAVSTSTTAITTPKLIAFTKGGGSQTVYVGETQEDDDANATAGEADGGSISIGAQSSGANFFNVRIAELILMRSKLTAAERTALYAYARARYGV